MATIELVDGKKSDNKELKTKVLEKYLFNSRPEIDKISSTFSITFASRMKDPFGGSESKKRIVRKKLWLVYSACGETSCSLERKRAREKDFFVFEITQWVSPTLNLAAI